MTRLTLLALALITATLTGCNADWLLGPKPEVCPWVTTDSTWHHAIDPQGAVQDSVLSKSQVRGCE